MDDKQRYERGMASAARCSAMPGWTKPMPARIPSTRNSRISLPATPGASCGARPHYDERTRRILVIGTMIALDKWAEFRMHVRCALTEGGFSADDIKEIILQQAIYCGVPAANHAFKEARRSARRSRQVEITTRLACSGLRADYALVISP